MKVFTNLGVCPAHRPSESYPKEMQQTERSVGWCKVLESTGAGLAEEDKHAQ